MQLKYCNGYTIHHYVIITLPTLDKIALFDLLIKSYEIFRFCELFSHIISYCRIFSYAKAVMLGINIEIFLFLVKFRELNRR